MIVDGHAHACGTFLTCEQLEAYLDEHKIDKVVLCGGESESKKNYRHPMFSKIFLGERLAYFFNRIIVRAVKKSKAADHIKEQNMMVYAMTRKLPDRICNVFWVNPEDKEALMNMEDFYIHYGFYMIKLHQCWSSFDVNSVSCDKIFDWAAKNHIPVFLHLLSKEQVRQFVGVANKHKTTTFIVAHMIGSNYMKGKLKYKNVYFDLSAPQLYSNRMLKHALRYYGAARLVMGSDTPYGKDNMERIQRRLLKLKVPKQERRKIMGDNLKWLLKL